MADANEFSQQIDYLNGGPLEKTWGPYPTKEAACLAIENKVDAEGRNMRMGKVVGIGPETNAIEHHWVGGFEDKNLVEFTTTPRSNSVSAAAIKNDAVTTDKASFIHKEIGKNKFNINDSEIALGQYLQESKSSALFGKLQQNDNYNVTAFIPIDPTKHYVINKPVRSAVLFDGEGMPIPGSGITGVSGGYVFSVLPSNTVSIQLCILITNWTGFQFEEGNTTTTFESYSERLVLKTSSAEIFATQATNELIAVINEAIRVNTTQVNDKAIIPQKTSFFEKVNTNLYNSSDPNIVTGFILAGTSGLPTNPNTTYRTTGFIEVSEGDVIVAGNNGNPVNLRFIVGYNSDKSRIAGSEDPARTSYTVPAGVRYVRTSFTYQTYPLYQVQKDAITPYVPYSVEYYIGKDYLKLFELLDNSVTSNKIANGSVIPEKILNKSLTKEKLDFISSENLFNPADPEKVPGYFLGSVGQETVNATYLISGYIPVKAGESFAKSAYFAGGAYSAFYAKSKAYLPNSASNAQVVTATQDGYLRVSVIQSAAPGLYKLAKGLTPGMWTPYSPKIDKDLIPKSDIENVATSIIGLPAKRSSPFNLPDGEAYTITDFPYHLKKGWSMSFYADVVSLSGVVHFGKGYGQYRGDWIMIDATKIYWKSFQDVEMTKGEITHGLNISTFIKGTINVDDSSLCTVILQTLGGFSKTTFQWTYEANFSPFIRTVDQALSNVKLNCASKEFQHPVWFFGDSYFGVSLNRWPGVMKSFGFFNMLLNGLAGQGSTNAIADLQRCLKYGTPKYLVWCLGMNDSDAVHQTGLNTLISTCNNLGITLILATIPTIPTRNKEIITDRVRNSGYRYIDFYKAVGANSSGVWYPGYLSFDGIHPDPIGAQALATQVLADFPELMQYGVLSTTGNVGETVGDK